LGALDSVPPLEEVEPQQSWEPPMTFELEDYGGDDVTCSFLKRCLLVVGSRNNACVSTLTRTSMSKLTGPTHLSAKIKNKTKKVRGEFQRFMHVVLYQRRHCALNSELHQIMFFPVGERRE